MAAAVGGIAILLFPVTNLMPLLWIVAAQRRESAFTKAPDVFIACTVFDTFTRAAVCRTSPVVLPERNVDWNALPASDRATRHERLRLRIWIRKASRSLATMALPLCVEVALHRGWVVVDPAQRSWLNAVLLLWIGFIALSLVDPDYEFTSKTLDAANKFPLFNRLTKHD